MIRRYTTPRMRTGSGLDAVADVGAAVEFAGGVAEVDDADGVAYCR
jgi:hypothetical protein